MGIEDKLPAGFMLTSLEEIAGYCLSLIHI